MRKGIIQIVMALEDSDHAIDREALCEDERLLESSTRFNGANIIFILYLGVPLYLTFGGRKMISKREVFGDRVS